MAEKKPIQHSMMRRSAVHDYSRPGIYHITVHVAEGMGHPLGRIIGSDADNAAVALSAVGSVVEHELLTAITTHYDMITVDTHIVMPEHLHFILIVHKNIVSKNGRPAHLGQVIAGFKQGCNRAFWDITGQQEVSGAAKPHCTVEGWGSAEAPMAGVHGATTASGGEGATPASGGQGATPASGGQGATPASGGQGTATVSGGFAVRKERYGTGRPPLFAPGYCDVMPIEEGQLEQQRAYIRNNPRSRWLRSHDRARLQPQRETVGTALSMAALCKYLKSVCPPCLIGDDVFAAIESRLLFANKAIVCDSYGDRALLQHTLLPVVCHRNDAARFAEQKRRCLEEAAKGAVLVSPRIAAGEQEIVDEAIRCGYPVALIEDNGFPPVYHPSTERIAQCSEGRLLLLTPWQYHYRGKNERITVPYCKTMNGVAQAICRRKDSWWMNGVSVLRTVLMAVMLLMGVTVMADGVRVKGNVFGGGNQADVKTNTTVNMSAGKVEGSVYGGGNLGSVGTFTRTAPGSGHEHGSGETCLGGKPTAATANTGTCTVTINGDAEIGPDNMQMKKEDGAGNPLPPDDTGYVFGASRGEVADPEEDIDIEFRAYVNETFVTIGGTAFIKGSVYGGSENGRVLSDTHVYIQDHCQIGNGDGVNARYYEALFIDPSTATAAEIATAAASLHECASWDYGEDTNGDGINDTFTPYDRYGAKTLGATVATDGHTFYGNVFGGGSGLYPYKKKDKDEYEWLRSAGRVEGNTHVEITGGHILTSVYGGCELTDVGDGQSVEEGKGKCFVKMSGGTLGVPRTLDQIKNHPVTCYLFGAGKGDQRIHFNQWTNVGSVEVEVSGSAIIYGSVFGGGEDGHVLKDVSMTIGGGVIGTWGTSYVEGNVFGGGRGFAGDAYTAGNVAGCVNMNITGGHLLGSVYGGGRLASVGYGLFMVDDKDVNNVSRYGRLRPDNTGDDTANTAIANFKRGYVTINISGGIIGNDIEYKYNPDATDKAYMPYTLFEDGTNRLLHTKGGNVFAGGMGRREKLDGITPIPYDSSDPSSIDRHKLGNVKGTKVTISGDAWIKSNVYGGGELGAVRSYYEGELSSPTKIEGGNTEIIIDGGTIGTMIGEGIGSGGTKDESTGNNRYCFGSVFGGGYGTEKDVVASSTAVDTHPAIPYTKDMEKFAALVVGNSTVTMNGGTVLGSVYGGGEVACIGGSSTVEVKGGNIGVNEVRETDYNNTGTGYVLFGSWRMGNVYGGGRGSENAVNAGLIRSNATVTISGSPKIYHNVYGGGALGSVGWFTFTDGEPTACSDGTGTATIEITGTPTIGISGRDNGMVNGSSRGDVAKPTGTPAVDIYDRLGWVNNTIVTVGTLNDETAGPHIKGSLYGGGENGHNFGDATVTLNSGTIGIVDTSDPWYTIKDADGNESEALTMRADIVRGNVYGSGCGTDTYTGDDGLQHNNPKAGIVLGNTTVTINGGTVKHDVYGGGSMGAVGGSVAVTMKDGWVKNNLYGGCAKTNSNFDNATDYGKETESLSSTTTHTTTVNLLGGMIEGFAFGGGLGEASIPAYVYGDVKLNLNGLAVDDYSEDYSSILEAVDWDGNSTPDFYVVKTNTEGCSVRRVFGCNNVNGTPKGDVKVNIWATQNRHASKAAIADKFAKEGYSTESATLITHLADTIAIAEELDIAVDASIKDLTASSEVSAIRSALAALGTSIAAKSQDAVNAIRYDVNAVYGGGNEAAYTPISGKKTEVDIHSCPLTSIEYVYGGGNAARVPSTHLKVYGTYEIYNVFGGGNGKDALSDGSPNPGADVTGDTNVELMGGRIHEAYGGSNTLGTIGGNINLASVTSSGECPLLVDKVVSAGKNADIDGDVNVILDCVEGYIPQFFAGADQANVKGSINMTITSGHFGDVFGGNDLSGIIAGHIKLNIEETECTPIIIDNLYLGGNQAAYSRYGYYVEKDNDGNPVVTGGKLSLKPRTSATDSNKPVKTFNGTTYTDYSQTEGDTFTPYAEPELNIISCTRIGNVFGGGYGVGAAMYADPVVNINMIPGEYASGVPAVMTAMELTATEKAGNPNSLGIITNVYGGGNAADVHGNTTVNIGTATTVDLISTSTTGNPVKGGYITGNVFGGGNLAIVTGDTHVNICGTQIPDPTKENGYTDTAVDHSGTADFTVSIGNSVYGGGNEADVKGNTFVTMADGYVFNGIFGGGLSGSVGTFATSTDVTDWGHTANHEGCIGKPTSCTAGGTCYVVVSGGTIGPVEVATEGMNRMKNGHGDPVPEGWVWGAGCGIVDDPSVDQDTHFRTYVNNTDVTIKGTAFILESIIGGGEFGRVLGNTLVKIEGGQIGVGEMSVTGTGTPADPYVAVPYSNDQWAEAEAAVRAGDASRIAAAAASMPECSHFPLGRNTGTEQEPNWVYDTYDPSADEYKTAHPDSELYSGGSTDHASDGKTWIGCVFAGGSGYMPYVSRNSSDVITGYEWVKSAGWVEGDTELRISGGHILTNVYGGNEYTDVKGKCTVKMSGGTIGVPRTLAQIAAHPLTCYLFGAGKGDPRSHFDTFTNVGSVDVEISGGIIFGSIFGGSEDGHVLGDVDITIKKNADSSKDPFIGTWGTSYVDGNVFGGGRGFSGDNLIAGAVGGKVDIKIEGGTMLGSIYGGGRLGSVGLDLRQTVGDAANADFGKMMTTGTHGDITIDISGGTIGNDREYIIPNSTNMPDGLSVDNIGSWTTANWTSWKTHNYIPSTEFVYDGDREIYRLSHTKGGNVFAGSMGRLYKLDNKTVIPEWTSLGMAKSTTLTVRGTARIKSSVYGGGELGWTYGTHEATIGGETLNVSTEVTVSGGTIGTEVTEGETVRYTYGSVFGGGYGSEIETVTDENSRVTYPKFQAGRVKYSTKVDMSSGTVLASVYGGGEMANVGYGFYSYGQNGISEGILASAADAANTYVTVSGGTIGKNKVTANGNTTYFGGATMGNVYGGGSGLRSIVRCGLVLGNTHVDISGSPTIYHSIYGGGAFGSVGDYEYTTGQETVTVNGQEVTSVKVFGINNLHTPDTGIANVTITGGTIGTDGCDNGMVYGSSRGDVVGNAFRDDYAAWVYDTHVTIGNDDGTGPQVNGSVYGSGENGHTFHDTEVNIKGGTVGILTGSPVTKNGVTYNGAEYGSRGNVYGGGCGTDTYTENGKELYKFLAGIVQGNTTVNMTGGRVVRAVYGGGSMGSVGTFTLADATYLSTHPSVPLGKPISCAAGTGLCTVNISGGTVGPDNMSMPHTYGNVFGAGRGEANDTTVYTNLNVSGYFNKTEVTIKENAFVKGSVYGGSESGHVLSDTWVKIQGGQIGCGNDKTVAYTSGEWTTASPAAFATCPSWTYVEDGLVYDPYASILVDGDWKYADGTTSTKGGATTATDGHTFYGNVFGGGSGYVPFKDGNGVSRWVRSAGRVEGNTVVDITGGHILTSVYGANECTDVLGSSTVNMSGGTVGVPRTKVNILANPALGYLFGGGKGDKRVLFNTWTNVASTAVNVTGGTVYGSVYGGGEDGHVLGDAVTTIEEASGKTLVIGCDGTSGYDGNVFGGGQGSISALTAGVVGGNIDVKVKKGTMHGSVYGGGRLAAVGTFFEDPNGEHYGSLHPDEPEKHGNITVSLTGGTIDQDVFGGGMGTTDNTFNTANELGISRNVIVELNKNVADTGVKGCVVKGNIFGCNNLNTSPRGTVKVHIYKTQNDAATQIANSAAIAATSETPAQAAVTTAKVAGRYDVRAVYGGGNMAAYEPADANGKTEVIIDGCDLTSIETVYGGGNAASVPATDVTVNGTFEINEVFGGGNGKDQITVNGVLTDNPGANVGYRDYSAYESSDDAALGAATKPLRMANYAYGSGHASVNVYGGRVHSVYGGSNTKGNVRTLAVTTIDEQNDCDINVDEAYGGGKSAPMDGDSELRMPCVPRLEVAYGGAQAADIEGDVLMTITNGTFGQVFGGNNVSGTISGTITVNIEETGCRPIIIGQLYGGGNLAPYTAPWVDDNDHSQGRRPGPTLNVRSFTSIGDIYGGGLGAPAVITGDTHVNVNVCYGLYYDRDASVFAGNDDCPAHAKGTMGAIKNVFGGGNEAPVIGNTNVHVGTTRSETFVTIPDPTDADLKYTIVRGADIRGDVYGGGNKAKVTGNTNVVIGYK